MLAVADAFTTDGVSLHLGMQKPKAPSSLPSSSVHYIDALKAAMRSADDLHVTLHASPDDDALNIYVQPLPPHRLHAKALHKRVVQGPFGTVGVDEH